MRLVSVAVPVPTLDLLTYLVPESLDRPAVGARVLVPLGTRQVTGIVVRTEATGEDAAVLRELLDVIDDEAFLPADVVDLAAWIAEYYASGPGAAMAAAMPPFAWIESEQAAAITEAGQAQLSVGQQSAVDRQQLTVDVRQSQVSGPGRSGISILRALQRGEPVPLRVLARKLHVAKNKGGAPIHSLVRALERAGLVTTTTALRGRSSAFKTHKVAAITAEGLEPSAASTLIGQRQREALAILQGSPGGMSFAALRDRGIEATLLRRLATRGLVAIRQERVERDPFKAGQTPEAELAGLKSCPICHEDTRGVTLAQGSSPVIADRQLTSEQTAALDRLRELAARRDFAVALLHGVTGSGKTEVYLRLAADVLTTRRSVLVLVPEIALTPALVSLFRATFGNRVAVQHSGLSDGERHDQWRRIRAGEIDLVVGTRSAVFAPVSNLGLIVVDEEPDASYKQEETPRYHGRDVAVMRAKRAGALVVLGSATPAMETYQNALAGRYEHLVLARRVLDRPLAAVRIVNMRDEYAREGPETIFSAPLRGAIDARLAAGEQVLVLLNRRGFATAVFCRQCGNVVECPNCSVSLTVHGRHTRRARCHYCNYSTTAPLQCPACAAPYLEHLGVATERLEEEAARLFPHARVARLDRDVAARRGATAEVLARFASGAIDILIGTQMIAKGHDFPRVTLVGVISADVGLGLPDFRAAERTFQLLTQVVGRAGRGERPGEAIIQTLFPGHYSVRLACEQDYVNFFAREIEFRRAMRYPPHVSLVNAIVRGPTLQAAMEDGADLVRRVRADAHGIFRVLGPAPAALTKLRGEHRAQFFVKGTRRAAMRQAVEAAVAARPDLCRRVTIDVDPLSVL